MLTSNINDDVLSGRRVMIQLLQEVRFGRHELVIVLEEQSSQTVCLIDENVGKLNTGKNNEYEC